MNVPRSWWDRLPSRLLEEDAALAALRDAGPTIIRSYRWLRGPDGDPRVRVALLLGTREVDVEVRFPAHFPEGCPSVRPVAYDKPTSSHQFVSTGIFCLELGPDNWHPRFLVADLIQSTWKLLATEILSEVEPIDIPSRHVATVADVVRASGGIVLCPPEYAALLEPLESKSACDFVWAPDDDLRLFPVAIPKGAATPGMLPGLQRQLRSTGVFLRLSDTAPQTVPREAAEFIAFLADFAEASAEDTANYNVFIFRWASGARRTFVRLNKTAHEFNEVMFDREVGVRSPSGLDANIHAARVAIIGLGSLGSKVAVSLARIGVSRFVLVDGDVLNASNICRHEGRVADIGEFKVTLIKRHIREVSFTEPDVVCYPIELATPTNPELHARILEDLGTADVIIDATANPEVFCLLAMVVSDRRLPLVWGEVFGGGFGGMIASAHPADTPCPRCVRAAFLGTATGWPPAPMRQPVRPYGGSEDVLVAADADVSLLAAALTNRVLDVVLRRVPTPPAVLVVGLRRGWIFDADMQSVSVPVRADDTSCARCWCPPSEPDDSTAARATALFVEPNDVENTSSE